MPTPRARLTTTALGAALLLAASGCSVLEPDKIDYKSASRGTSLEVPPDLTQLSGQSRYQMSGGAITASGYQAGQVVNTGAGVPTAANQIGDISFVGQGRDRWLHVARPADKLWQPVLDFWQENGFVLTTEQPSLGLMETDWAENRAKIPQDFIRKAIGKVFDSLYSSGERDRFRTRIERSADGGTDIFITHRGMEEVYTNAQNEGGTGWQPRERDLGLEAEMLRRPMVKLGVSQQQSEAMLTAAKADTQPAARIVTTEGGAQAVQFSDDFDRAWRRVSLALDRTGFTVEDRDRSKGIYYVRYVDPTAEKKEPGFFSRMFGGASTPIPALKYQLVLRSQSGNSTLSVQDDKGAPANSADAQRIVKVLADELR
jgi:outer membrane protein assembly factor BamC